MAAAPLAGAAWGADTGCRPLAADAGSLADNPGAGVRPAPVTSLREAFTDGQAAPHLPACRRACRLPGRISATLGTLHGEDGLCRSADEAVFGAH